MRLRYVIHVVQPAARFAADWLAESSRLSSLAFGGLFYFFFRVPFLAVQATRDHQPLADRSSGIGATWRRWADSDTRAQAAEVAFDDPPDASELRIIRAARSPGGYASARQRYRAMPAAARTTAPPRCTS